MDDQLESNAPPPHSTGLSSPMNNKKGRLTGIRKSIWVIGVVYICAGAAILLMSTVTVFVMSFSGQVTSFNYMVPFGVPFTYIACGFSALAKAQSPETIKVIVTVVLSVLSLIFSAASMALSGLTIQVMVTTGLHRLSLGTTKAMTVYVIINFTVISLATLVGLVLSLLLIVSVGYHGHEMSNSATALSTNHSTVADTSVPLMEMSHGKRDEETPDNDDAKIA